MKCERGPDGSILCHCGQCQFDALGIPGPWPRLTNPFATGPREQADRSQLYYVYDAGFRFGPPDYIHKLGPHGHLAQRGEKLPFSPGDAIRREIERLEKALSPGAREAIAAIDALRRVLKELEVST